MARERPARRAKLPLDRAALDQRALAYVSRYATTRKRLADYLLRKVRELGWDGEGSPPIQEIVERLGALRYVDDQAYATIKADGLGRRGYGPMRVRAALKHAGVSADDAQIAQASSEDQALEAAFAFARRKHIGPYARTTPDAASQKKALAALCRAGHSYEIARKIILNADEFTIDEHMGRKR